MPETAGPARGRHTGKAFPVFQPFRNKNHITVITVDLCANTDLCHISQVADFKKL